MQAKHIAFIGLALAVAGCGTQLQRSEGLQASGNDFSKGLYDGYLTLARAEYGESDFADSDVFAQRAKAAAANSLVEPEKIDARALPANRVATLSGARDRLVTALNSGAREKAAADAASAQVAFDCWMQEQEENRQPADIAACQQQFTLAMASVEQAIAPPPPAPVAAAPAPAPSPEPREFVVMFDFDDTTLSTEAAAKLQEAAVYAAGFSSAEVKILGHADRAGADDYNDALASLRAAMVADGLRKAGLSGAKLDIEGRGEKEPAMVTADGVPEPKNRRVTILVTE